MTWTPVKLAIACYKYGYLAFQIRGNSNSLGKETYLIKSQQDLESISLINY